MGSRGRRDADMDIEMGTRTTVTATTANRNSPDSTDQRLSAAAQGSDSRDSDDYPIMGTINKTTTMQWTVEEVKTQKR